MSAAGGTQLIGAAPRTGDDWRAGVGLWAGLSSVAVFVIVYIAIVASPPATADDLGAFIDPIARWALGSGSHVAWSAPTLIAAGFGLAAICAAPIEERPGFGSPVPMFAFVATLIATALTVWTATVIAAFFRLDALERENPFSEEQFSTVSGLLLIAPVGIAACLSAGRFQLAPLERRRRLAEERVRALHVTLGELGPTSPSTPSVVVHRLFRYLSLALLVLTVCALAAITSWSADFLPRVTITLAMGAAVLSASSCCATALGAWVYAEPAGMYWTQHGRTRPPTILGAFTWLIVIAGICVPGVATAAMSTLIIRASPSGTPLEFTAAWLPTIGPILAGAVYAILLWSPLALESHRESARRARRRSLIQAEAALASLDHQLRQQHARSRRSTRGLSIPGRPRLRARP